MAGDTFDAGTVYAESRLGRNEFQRDLRAVRDDMRKLQKDQFELVVRISQDQFKKDVRQLRTEFERGTRGQFVIRPELDADQLDRQMRAIVAKWRKEQLTLPARLDERAFEAEMKRLSAKMKSIGGIDIPVNISRESLEKELAKLSKELAQAGKPINIEVELATEKAHAQADALHAAAAQPVAMPVDADTTVATGKLKAFLIWARKQTIKMILDIKIKDIKKAIGFLNQMSYRLSTVGTTFDRVGKWIDRSMASILQNLTQGIMLAGKFAASVMTLGGAALGISGLSAEILGLASALSTAGWAAAAIPGVIFTLISGITTLKMGMGGVGEALKNAFDPKNAEKFAAAMKELHPEAQKFVRVVQQIAPAWKAVRKEVQGALFKDLAGDLKQLSTVYLPILGAQLPMIASAFNSAARDVMSFMTSIRAQQDVNTILGESAKIWYDVGRAITPILSILLDLAAVALPLLSEMTASLYHYADGWASSVHAMRETGELADLMSRGFTTVAMVIGLVQNVLSILNSVMDAAARAGFGVFQNYTMAAGALARFLKSAEGIAVLDSIFGTLAQAMAIVQPFLNELSRVLVQYVLPAVIQVLPAVAQGFAALTPALQPLGQIIAAVLPILVQLAVAVAEKFAQALIFVAPHLLSFLDMLKQNPAAAAIVVGILGTLAFAFSHLGTIMMIIGKIMVFRQLQTALLALGAPGAAVNGVLARMMGWMGSLSRVMGMLLGPIGLIIGGLIAMYMNSASFRDAVNNLLGALMGLVGSALQPFMTIIGILAPIIGTVAGILGDVLAPVVNIIAEGLKFLNPVITALTYAWIAWTVATWALNSALLANPITWIILAIIALVVAVVLLVRNWDTVWTAVSTAISWAWENVIKPILDAIGAAFNWLMTNVLAPVGAFFATVWNGIATVVSWAWNNVIWPVVQAIGQGLAILGTIIGTVLVTPFYLGFKFMAMIWTWLWNTIFAPLIQSVAMPLIRALGDFFAWLWSGAVAAWNGIQIGIAVAWAVIQAIFAAVMAGLRILGGVFVALWNAYVVPAWRGIQAAAAAAWNWVNANVIQPFMGALRFLGNVFTMLWVQYVAPAWAGIRAAGQAAWNFIQTQVFAPLGRGLDAIGRAFDEVSAWIGRTWDTIKEKTRGPVQFVVDVVYNNGIRNVWNGIASLFGSPQLPAVRFRSGGIVADQNFATGGIAKFATGPRLENYATGGVLGGYQPGRDSVMAMLSPGEGVLVPEAVKGLGVGFVSWANGFFAKGRVAGGANYPQGQGNRMANFTRDQKPRRYATGGVVDGVIGKVDPAFVNSLPIQRFAGGGIVDGIGDMMSGLFGFISKVFTDPVGAVKELFEGVMGSSEGTPGQGSWTDALKQIPVKTVEGVIKKVKEWVESIMSMGGGGNWAPVIMQALAMVGQAPSNLGITQKRLMQESGGNPTIVNRWDSNWAKGTPSVGLMQVIGPTFAANAGPMRGVGPFLYGTSVNPLANIYSSMRYTLGRYGSLAAGYGKANGYKNGGVLKPGEMGYNETGHDEYVFNRDQLRTVVNGGKLGTPQSVTNSVVRNQGGSSRGSGNIDTLIVQAPEGATAKETVDEAVFAWKHANNGAYGGTDR